MVWGRIGDRRGRRSQVYLGGRGVGDRRGRSELLPYRGIFFGGRSEVRPLHWSRKPALFGFVDYDGAGFHYPADVADGYVDVGERVALDGGEVGVVAGGYGAEFGGFA